MSEVSRRKLFGLAGAGIAVAGAGAAAGIGIDNATSGDAHAATTTVDFHGEHQSGMVTPTQANLHFAALDVKTKDRAKLQALLKKWTEAARRMTAGQEVVPGGAIDGGAYAPPGDTGEALDLPASNLTLTIGFGPSLFDDRFGLAAKRPAQLIDLPLFPKDKLDPARSGGDLCIQACADDPQVAFHAVRNLRRLAQGTAVLRWFQLGFGRTSTTSSAQQTPRNLMGFKDGTNNIKRQDAKILDAHVWVGADTDQPWMRGGSYVVTRRIRMLLEAWDRDYLADQENVFGRQKVSGAPLGTAKEFDTVPLAARGDDGSPVIPAGAHIRLAAPATNGGITLLRRGYSYTDGVDPETGELDAGLFFIAFQRDPRTGFIPVQRRLAASDALNEYIQHTSSAIFAVPPGVSATGGDYWARALLA